MPKSEDLVMFAIVAAAAATGVFLYAWAVNNFSDRVPALADSAEAGRRLPGWNRMAPRASDVKSEAQSLPPSRHAGRPGSNSASP